MKPGNHSNAVIKGALALTVAALIVKVLSAVYRVPFQNIVGDIGFYIYQQVYPFYGVALVLSTYGFPVIISKLYIERKSKNDKIGIQRLLTVSTLFMLLLGFLAFMILYFGAEWLSTEMNDPNLAILLKVIAIVFLIVPFTSVLRGYFQGESNMVPTAYSQVGEQLIRVGTILLAAALLVSNEYSLYVVGAGAVFGSVTGGLVGLIILVTFIWVKKSKERLILPSFKHLVDYKEIKSIVKALVVQGIAICISSMLLIFMQLADSLNLYSLLITSGIEGEAAKELKGIYDRGQPLIQLGSVVATSMSLALVPLITSEKLKRNLTFLYDKIQFSLQISLTIGLGATIGLMTIIKPTNWMLFRNTQGSDVLALLSIMILLSSLIITTVAILQGLGITIFPALIILMGLAIKYIFNGMFVPDYGTMGAALASNGALAIILMILFIRLIVQIKKPIFSFKFLATVGIAALSMFLVLKGYINLTDFIYRFGHNRLLASMQALSAVFIGGFTYIFIVIRGKVFTIEELTMLPFGSKLMYLFPKKNRR